MARHELALISLDENIQLDRLAEMLIAAYREAIIDGVDPYMDPAVTIISGRIGFSSAAGDMSGAVWDELIHVCASQSVGKLHLDKSAIQ